jgi:Zn-dependent protease with chaperone function/tetratricopeptide (TPR) repeat protein
VVLLDGAWVRAQTQDAKSSHSSPNPLEAALARPLSLETWPLWSEAYLRIYHDDNVDPEKEREFYEKVHTFLRSTGATLGGPMPRELAADPIVWVALSSACHHAADEADAPASSEPYDSVAESSSRKAISLGDPQALGSMALAATLVYRGIARDRKQALSGDIERGLREAEDRLRHVERVVPHANVNLWRSRIARIRGDSKTARELLSRAIGDHPKSAGTASDFLIDLVSSKEKNLDGKLADQSGPIAGRFPGQAQVQALHALALYRDQRFVEAAETFRRARDLDQRVTRMFGDELAKSIEEGSQLTPGVVNGLSALKANRYEEAITAFRQEQARNPHSSSIARLLARALIGRLTAQRTRSVHLAESSAQEIRALSQQFPGDPEIHAALAGALSLSGHKLEAASALDRVRSLGGRPEAFFDAGSVNAIQHDADSEKATRFWSLTAQGVVAGAALWTGVMFALGVILAWCIPRVPRSQSLIGDTRSRREVWLERLYLVVLSLGLLGFYVSVPLVAAGLLAVTLLLFGLLLAIRILHFGVLQRGLWAFWNVLRCVLIGPQGEVLGIEATSTEHPRLFESLSQVADRLKTRPVDRVYLTPSANISVMQEGSGPFGLLGKRERVLHIGISTLPLISREEFHSILAHEYGHFSQNDTFYGRFIFQVSASLATSLAVMSAAGGFMNYINPFYWFWWCYLKAYTLLAKGFSRSREFLADRQAVAAYGKNTFISGLTKVSVDGVLFESTVYNSIQQLLSQGRAFTNAFDAFRKFREGTEIAESRERLLEELRQTRPRWLDTHPTYSERLAAVAEFPDTRPPVESEPAIELLCDHAAVEATLTSMLTSRLHDIAQGQG